MSRTWSRRKLLGTTAGAIAGLGVIGTGLRLRTNPATSSADGDGDEELGSVPPRVVGLRTFGGNFRFDPVGLRIEPGSSVTWLNMGDFHSSTAFHPDNSELLGGDVPLRIPEGAEPWHSGMLGLMDGTQFEYTFTVEGVYDYFCQPHYLFGMVGRIIVSAEGSGQQHVALPLSGLPEVARDTMPSVESIMGPGGRAFEWAARLNGVLYLIANGEEAIPSARRAHAAMERDPELQDLVAAAGQGQGRRLSAALGGFLEGVETQADYDDLVARSDAVKSELAAVTGLV